MARKLGASGSIARAVVGTAVVALTIGLDGLRLWAVAAAVTVLPLGVVVASVGVQRGFDRLSVDSTQLRARIGASAIVLGALVVIGTTLTFVSPVDAGALYLFVGSSMIVAAVRGDAGCEVLSIPNAILRRRDTLWCPVFAAFDHL